MYSSCRCPKCDNLFVVWTLNRKGFGYWTCNNCNYTDRIVALRTATPTLFLVLGLVLGLFLLSFFTVGFLVR